MFNNASLYPLPRVQVVVVGAGGAGIAAAIAAARTGADVLLVEANRQIGGTVAHALIHTIAGLYNADGLLINPGLPAELSERLAKADPATGRRRIGRAWVLNVCPAVYLRTVQDWVAQEPRIRLCYETRVERVYSAGTSIGAVEVAGPAGTATVQSKAVVDTTGTAEVVRMVDPALVIDDPARVAAGLIFSLRGVVPGALRFPAGVRVLKLLRQAVADHKLPAECASVWIDAGVYPDEAYVKSSVVLTGNWRDPAAEAWLLSRASGTRSALMSFLKGLPAFAEAEVDRIGALGIREGGRIVGEHCLTADEVRRGARFDDAACRCCWPIEYWDPVKGDMLEYLPPQTCYEIPMQSLKVRGMTNLWSAGKCLSADHLAQASARVSGCCWAMGEAVGQAAAGS